MECPCDGCGYESSERGVKQHHAMKHGESLAQSDYTCTNCDTVFQRADWHAERISDNAFCSQECKHEYQSDDDRNLPCPYEGCDFTSVSELGVQQHHKRTHGESLTLTEDVCDCCGETVVRQRSKLQQFDHTFCDDTCRAEWLADELSERRTKDGNPNWIEDTVDDYGVEWPDIAEDARQRDDYECQRCGMTNATHQDEIGVSLHVHHQRPVRDFENTTDAHDLENLITLCAVCHRRVETADE